MSIKKDLGWGADLVTPLDSIGLESMGETMASDDDNRAPSNFKPVNIAVDNGEFHATIYACHCTDGSMASQQLAIWFGSLDDTNIVNLTVLSLLNDIPLPYMVNLMSALVSTKARLNIYLDQVVTDGLAYFYLIPEKITKGSEGALFIPSYMVHREEDASGPSRAIHDFYKWLVSEAVTKGIVTQEEATKLDKGAHVGIPNDRIQ